MMYTINSKQYSEFDIKKRCAELMGVKVDVIGDLLNIIKQNAFGGLTLSHYDPCNNPSDTWPIIEKCWDELNEVYINQPQVAPNGFTEWDMLIEKHNCTKLVAACICFIEIN